MLDIKAQVFDSKGDVIFDKYVFSVDANAYQYDSIISWKDKNDHFYALIKTEEYPYVRKFEITDLPK